MAELIFLGTGGGRFAMTTQLRATGGFRLNIEDFKIHIDPGPGAIVRSIEHKQNPQSLNCIIVTHGHPDHVTDANVLIEAMTKGTTKERGILITSESVVKNTSEVGPSITKYHLGFPKEKHILKPGDKIELQGKDSKLHIEATKTVHSDPTTFGLKFKFDDKIISYTSDTEYFEELPDLYKNSDILIINVLRPRADRIKFHMCTDDAIKLLKEAKPKLAIITHFGMKMIRGNTVAEAQRIEKETGIVTLAAEDGMKINIEEAITQLKQHSLKEFEKK